MRREQAVGPHSVLLGLYVVFVVAAGARSGVQFGTHAGRAPLAYALSGAAALVYATGLVLVRRVVHGGARLPARISCGVELAGVVIVGAVSVLRPATFPDDTVWSGFGAGYLFVPVVLPLATLAWLRRR